NWHNNFSFVEIHTQSPRTRQFGGGANGGMDDRFDMILTSQSINDEGVLLILWIPILLTAMMECILTIH
ncbi:MAG: hypothetical protein IH795_01365, partial [Bacteroidetes bacterium]|nr:hypothetical protein [Bacteroidota bacterium]